MTEPPNIDQAMSDWSRIERLFDDASRLEPDARETYLRAHAESNSEFESAMRLVRASELSTNFLSTHLPISGQGVTLDPGAEIGGWRVLELLGVGGMGEVYRAERLNQTYTQSVALKIIRVSDENVRQRFERERGLLARLEHPGIARFIDGDKAADGRLFMAIELIEGDRLTDYVVANKLNERDRLALFLKLCEAVSFAHARLVLHRDINPNNVLVDERSQIKLIDFGVAYFLADEDEDRGAPLTVAYAAPEQLNGDAVSTATDIYALGLVLFEVLSGNRRGTGSIPAVGGELNAIIDKCLRPLPEERYGSVDGLVQDVQDYLNSMPVRAFGGGLFYRFKKWISRHQFSGLALSAFLLSLILGISATSLYAQRAQNALIVAEAAQAEWEFQARTTSGLSFALQSLYGAEDNTGARIEPQVIDQMLLKLASDAEAAARAGNLQQAYDLYAIGQQFMSRYDFAKAANVYERFLEFDPDDPYLMVEVRSNLVQAWDELGRTEQAVDLARQVLSQRASLKGAFSRNTIRSAQVIAAGSGELADQEQLIAYIGEAIERESKKAIEDQFDISWYYNQLGVAHMRQKSYGPAAAAFEATLFRDRTQPIRSREWITSATNAAQLQIYFLREGAPAISYLPEYLPFTEGEFGDDPLGYGFIQGLRAEAYLLEGNAAMAERVSFAALPRLTDDRAYRDGWYYMVVAMRARALGLLGRLDDGHALILEAKQELADGAVAGTYATCVLGFAELSLHSHQKISESVKQRHEALLRSCQAADPNREDLPPPVQVHADAALALIEN